MKDLAAFVSPQLLGLTPGSATIPVFAETVDGTLISGVASAQVK